MEQSAADALLTQLAQQIDAQQNLNGQILGMVQRIELLADAVDTLAARVTAIPAVRQARH